MYHILQWQLDHKFETMCKSSNIRLQATHCEKSQGQLHRVSWFYNGGGDGEEGTLCGPSHQVSK